MPHGPGPPVPQPADHRRPCRRRLRRVCGHPRGQCHRVERPDPAVVALQEPMGNAVHAAFVEQIEGQTVVVTGCGPIGLCAVADRQGRGRVTGVRHRPRAVSARDRPRDGRRPGHRRARATVPRVLEATGGDGVDVVLEMSGAQPALDTRWPSSPAAAASACSASSASRPRWTSPTRSSRRASALRHLRAAACTTPGSAPRRCCAEGLDVTPIITHRFDLADWEQAFDLIASRHAGKVVLLP